MAKDKRVRDKVPSTVARSDEKAVRTWKETHDSAVGSYGEGERAHRTAFASLKITHEKVGDHWEPKATRGPSDARAAKRKPASAKSGPAARSGARAGSGPTVEGSSTAEGVDANASLRHLRDVARELDIPGRSKMDKDELVDEIMKANRRETARARRG